MKIKETFLSLTQRTYPHGTEYMLFDKLPQNLEMDEFGNLYIKIGESDVMFTSHLDTATSALTDINHVFDGNIIKTDGKSILGADDKAGVTIMLYMIENNIPGLYYFFLGEEVGCIGSRKVSEQQTKEKLPYINKVISFDRRDTNSIITFQASKRCCSDTFGDALASQLNLNESTFKYETDKGGVYTDSAQFVKIYPECTNISVGYYSEHTFSERQDIEHLEKLANACLKVDWNSLPVERDPEKVEYSTYYSQWDSYNRSYKTYDDYEDFYTIPTRKENKIHFWDEEYLYCNLIVVDDKSGEYIKVDIDRKRLQAEIDSISDFLYQIEIEYDTLSWDGVLLTVTNKEGIRTETSRDDLIDYIPELDLLKLSESIQPSLYDRLSSSTNYDEYKGTWSMFD